MPPTKRRKPAPEAPERLFEQLRQRAATVSKTNAAPEINDFVLGPQDGFDPEVRVHFPLSLRKQEAYYYASRNGDIFAQVRAVLGDSQYDRIVAAFEPMDDSAELFLGFSQLLFDHVSGKGSGDVEGGSGLS